MFYVLEVISVSHFLVLLFFPGNLCLIFTEIRSKSRGQMSKSPPLLPRHDWSNSTISSMLGAETLQRNMHLYIPFPSPIFSPMPGGLNFELIQYMLSVTAMPIERSISCLQLVYFLIKALNVRRHNSCFVINKSLSSNHVLSTALSYQLIFDLQQLKIYCCVYSLKQHTPFK